MSNPSRLSKHERQVEFHGEAPFAKHDYRFRSRDLIRMAGSIWAESPDERAFRLSRESQRERMRNTPVGVGFGQDDVYGPDDDYSTVEFLSDTRDQGFQTYR